MIAQDWAAAGAALAIAVAWWTARAAHRSVANLDAKEHLEP